MKHKILSFLFAILTVLSLTFGNPGITRVRAAPTTCDTNVAEASSYSLIYQLSIPVNSNYDASLPAYSVDNTASVGGFTRVAYCLELDGNWVWVSMNAFTTVPGQVGVPVVSTGITFQQIVTSMNVASNVPGIVTGTGIATGNIEFWSNCYITGTTLGLPGANGSTYDYDDNIGGSPASCYGSMQVHNYGAGQTIFAWNGWDQAGSEDLGIGNSVGVNSDWTLANNAAAYSARTLSIYVVDLPTLTSFTRQNPATSPTNADTLVFRATFNEDVQNVDATDFAVNGTTTATVTNVATVSANVYDVTVSGGNLATFNGTVGLNLAGGQNIQNLLGVALPAGEPATDEIYLLDNTSPTMTITSTATDPTNTSPIPVTITFSEAVSGFLVGEINVGNGTASNFNTTDNITFTADITPTANGLVTVDVAANVAQDVGGNNNTAAVQFSITYDNTSPTVTITSTATDPTNTLPIPVTITFSEAVSGFLVGEINVGNGTASNFNTTDDITFTADITPTANGLVTVDVAANVAQNVGGNNNTAAVQFSITFDNINPIVASTGLNVIYTGTGPASFTVTFSKDVDDPAGNTATDDVTNPANYLLINKGVNGVVNTLSCAGGVIADDTLVTVSSVSYNNATFISTVTLTSALPVGSYRLLVCGTTSIVDLVGNPLNGGIDYTFDFTVQAVPTAPTTTTLPATGFAHGRVTILPEQPAAKAYASTDLVLEIPSLNVKMDIVGIPHSETSWDVTWLWNNAGWLNGSAFPTWAGNTVLTGHVWDSFNKPGPFANLRSLKYGDQIFIHAWDLTYAYEVRESSTVTNQNVFAVMKHEDLDWVTLVTCESYNPVSGNYNFRRVVRAVLVGVQ